MYPSGYIDEKPVGAFLMHRGRVASLLSLVLALACSPAAADPILVFGAGILVAPVKAAIAAAGLAPEAVAEPVFGSTGVLSERIATGEPADLYLSADLAQPRRLAEAGKARLVIPYARNRLCVVAKAELELTSDTLLDRLLAPEVRLATSTPKLDAAGDVAEAVFAKADALRAGTGEALRRKALHLIGTPGAMTPVQGRSISAAIFLADKADALLYWCNGQAATLADVPSLTIVELPSSLAVPVTLGMAVLTERPDAARLALFLVSEKGQALLAENGLVPLAVPTTP